MGEIVNLRRVKRRLVREADAQKAAENRARHGQSKAERDEASAVRRLQQRNVDNAKLSGDGEPGE